MPELFTPEPATARTAYLAGLWRIPAYDLTTGDNPSPRIEFDAAVFYADAAACADAMAALQAGHPLPAGLFYDDAQLAGEPVYAVLRIPDAYLVDYARYIAAVIEWVDCDAGCRRCSATFELFSAGTFQGPPRGRALVAVDAVLPEVAE